MKVILWMTGNFTLTINGVNSIHWESPTEHYESESKRSSHVSLSVGEGLNPCCNR